MAAFENSSFAAAGGRTGIELIAGQKGSMMEVDLRQVPIQVLKIQPR